MERGFTVKEAAKLLGYSTNSVYGFLKDGLIKSVRIGKGKFKIPQSEIDKFLTTQGGVAEKSDPQVSFAEAVKMEEAEREATREMVVKTVIVPGTVLPKPRPGKSLADLSGERPLHVIKLWFEERVGLPRLFDWFISLSSIVLGVSMYLYTKQVELLMVGRYALWFDPIKIALILGGFGLILADMVQEEYLRYRNLSNYFRFLLIVTYGGLSGILLMGNDLDGFLIHGLFAVAILVEAVMNVRSSTAYMFYIQGLLLGTVLILQLFPGDSGLSTISVALRGLLDGYSWVWMIMVIVFILITLYGFFWDKYVLKISSSVCGLFLVVLSIYYANNNYWSRSLFLLISGMVGVILPFWERFKERFVEDRPMVFKMFGSVLMFFSLVILLISMVQSILIADSNRNLSEKADYGRIVVQRTIDNIFSTLEGVAANPAYVNAVQKNDVVTIDGFAKSIFKNDPDLGEVITISRTGKPISSYPFSAEVMNSFYGAELFHKNALGGVRYFSRRIEPVPGVEKQTIVLSVPIFNANKEILGTIVAPVDVSSLSDRLSEIGVNEQRVSLVDGDGKWIVNNDASLWGQTIAEHDTANIVWVRERGEEIGYDGMGVYSLFRSSRAKDLGWTIIVSQPVFAILEVSRTGLVLILGLLSMTSLIVALSFILAKSRQE